MEFREERWFVRFRGQTLGPLSGDQVRAALRKNELSRDDKISSSREPAWIEISSHPVWSQVSVGGLSALKPLPSPQKLLQKKRAPLPKATAPVIDVTPIKVTTERNPGPVPKLEPQAVSAKPSRGLRPARKRKTKKKIPGATAAPVTAPEPLPATGQIPPTSVATSAPLALAADPRPRELPAPSPETNQLPALSDDPSWRLFDAAPAPKIPAAAVSAGPLGPESHSLLESLRTWENEERAAGQEKEKAELKFAAPNMRAASPLDEMPDRPVFHFPREENVSQAREARPAGTAPAARRIELHLSASKQFLIISGVMAALALAAAIYFFAFANKTRGPADSRLPDPSSPTIQPSEPGDPTPALKAPTRPRRD